MDDRTDERPYNFAYCARHHYRTPARYRDRPHPAQETILSSGSVDKPPSLFLLIRLASILWG